MSAIVCGFPVDESKLPLLKRIDFVAVNDDEIDSLTTGGRTFLMLELFNHGQIDTLANEKLKIFEESTNTVLFEVDLNIDSKNISVPVELIKKAQSVVKAEIVSTGQRSDVLGPWSAVVHYFE
jgi:hypothetical protein